MQTTTQEWCFLLGPLSYSVTAAEEALPSVWAVPILYNEDQQRLRDKNIRGLNLATVMCMTVQVTRLSL
jgi:hypothetical protein